MHQALRLIVVATCVSLLPGRPAEAQAPVAAPVQGTVTVQGRVNHPETVSVSELQAMPAVMVEVSHSSGKGIQANRYTGVLLWTLIKAADPIDENGPRTHLQHVFRVAGRDGYAVALAIGELDPDFEGKQVLIAYSEDGHALLAPKLIVPGDAKAGRSVHDLVLIEVY